MYLPPSDCFYFLSSLPDPSCIGRNTSAIFGAGPSFGLTPAETKPQFRPAPVKKAPEPRKIKRSHSDVALRKRPNLRRKSGDFSQLRKQSESETGHLNGSICNGTTESKPPVSPRSEPSDSAGNLDDRVGPLPEQHYEEQDDQSNRYPLFIQVNNSTQAHNKARVVKPVNKPPNQGAAKQEVRPRRSSSFTAPKKAVESKQVVGNSRAAQDIVKNGNLRREKSDLVRPNRIQTPTNVSAVPRPPRSNSSTSLKQDNNNSSPRSRSPIGLQREASDITKRSTQTGLRREKSDLARPRGQSKSNSPIVINEKTVENNSRFSSNRSLTSHSLYKSPSKSSIEETRSRAGSHSEMSKIPSRSRTPTHSEKTDSPVSNVSSVTKHHANEDRTPPRSKIPSTNKGDRGHDPVKKSSIPTSSRKDSASQKDKPTGKIPISSGLSQNRPDSAKENKDPTATTNGHEPTKQLSKIPSFGKSSVPKSKIPSVARKDSQQEKPLIHNGTVDEQPPVNELPKSKNHGAASTPQGSGIPMGITRIPSFTKSTPKHDEPVSNQSRIPTYPVRSTKTNESKLPTPSGSKTTTTDGLSGTQSRIPSTSQNKTVESKVPTPGGSKVPAKASPSSLPVAAKTSGIPKPGELEKGNRAPGHVGIQKGIPVASSPVESKKKIPKFASTAIPTVSSAKEESEPKPKRGIPTLRGRQLSVEKEHSSSDEGPATPPTTPINRDATESPLDKYIFSEAKKMEQLLRNEHIEVEVTDSGDLEGDDEFLRQEKEIEELEEKRKDNEFAMLHSKEAEDLISEVLKSYAPDINKENESEKETVKLFTDKDDNKNIKEKINIDDIVLQPVKSESRTLEEPQMTEQLLPKLHFEGEKTTSSFKEDVSDGIKPIDKDNLVKEDKEKGKALGGKAVSSGLKINMPSERALVSETEENVDKDTNKNEAPGIDSLGEYAQQARRSRSRQRKIVSPDSDEPGKEFFPAAGQGKEEQSQLEKVLGKKPEKEEQKKDIDKDKFGTVPFEAEKKPKEAAKSAKSKSKNDKPKFVIESSLGKDFYSSRKSNESVESRDSVHDDFVKSSFKPELSALVFENKVVKEPVNLKQNEEASGEEGASLEEAQFVDVDLNAEPAIAKQRRELSKSVDDLDEKTVKCMCGRGGKCSIM